MKKVISLIIVATVCLALASCGDNGKYEKYEAVIDCLESKDYDGAIAEIEKFKNGVYDSVDENGDPKTTAIEITSENWNEYFEVVQSDKANINQFGEIDDVYKSWSIVLKDGYNMAENNETSIAVEYNYTKEWRTVTKDLTAGTVTVGDLVPDKEPGEEKGAMTTITNKETSIIGNREYSGDTEAVPVSVEIVRMQGTLCIYGE